jgi:hypothetical protein
MSTIQTNAIVDAAGGNTATVNGISPLANSARFARNIVINGDMKVAQRATTATVGPNGTGEGYTVVDRFLNSLNGTVVSTFTQSTDAPSGFAKSAKIVITTADSSLASTDFWHFRTSLEGQDLQHIGKGTSGAKSLTVSFWVKSNKTGVYTTEFEDVNNSRISSMSYTINSSNVWEYKSLTFNPDTTGAFTDNPNLSLRINFWLVSGSQYQGGTFYNGTWGADVDGNRVHNSQVNLGDTVGNSWQITGLQLETGSVATDFEHKTYASELTACQRYYQNYIDYNYATLGAGRGASGGDLVVFTVPLPTQMRANPTITTNGAYYVYDHNSRTLTTPTSLSQSQGDATKNTNITLAMAFSSVVCDDDRVCVIGGHEANYILFDSEL